MNNHNIEREIKLNKLIERLAQGGYKVHMSYEESQKPVEQQVHSIDRYTLRELICGTLNVSDQHTVNGWIAKLVGLGILNHNPTSDKTVHGYTKPSNETKYFINKSKLTPAHITKFIYGSTTKTAWEPDPTSEQSSEHPHV
jgi:hypothetical protein